MITLRSSNPTARKKYRCELCGSTIEKGDKYNKTVFVEDGEIDETICCTKCGYIIGALNLDDDGIYYFEDTILDYVEEHHYHNNKIDKDWDLPFPKLVEKVYNELEKKRNK